MNKVERSTERGPINHLLLEDYVAAEGELDQINLEIESLKGFNPVKITIDSMFETITNIVNVYNENVATIIELYNNPIIAPRNYTNIPETEFLNSDVVQIFQRQADDYNKASQAGFLYIDLKKKISETINLMQSSKKVDKPLNFDLSEIPYNVQARLSLCFPSKVRKPDHNAIIIENRLNTSLMNFLGEKRVPAEIQYSLKPGERLGFCSDLDWNLPMLFTQKVKDNIVYDYIWLGDVPLNRDWKVIILDGASASKPLIFEQGKSRRCVNEKEVYLLNTDLKFETPLKITTPSSAAPEQPVTSVATAVTPDASATQESANPATTGVEIITPSVSKINITVLRDLAPGQTLGICCGPNWDMPIAFAKEGNGWKGQTPINKEWKFVTLDTSGKVSWEKGKNRQCNEQTQAFTVQSHEIRF